jgi:zinc/manganese transport system substrate-binding protein
MMLLCAGTAFAAEPVKVVASYSILGELVERVGGDAVTVRTLVGRDGDAHTFAPTPVDAAAVSDARVMFQNGMGFEPWLANMITATRTKATVVTVTAGIKPLRPVLEAHDGERGEHDVNPHVWHDVRLTMRMVENIRDALVQADPDRADGYRQRATAYLAELAKLDEWVAAETAKLPAARRKIVTSHDTFGYFAVRHGFEVLGTALGSFSTDVPDPSAKELAELVEKIKAAGVPAVFTENMVNPKVIEQLARAAKVQVAPPLFTDALGPVGSGGATYEKLVRHNVGVMVEALGR